MGTFDRKLEQVLSETRRKSISKRLFHGTVALETLHNILSNGLKPGGARASYNLELRRGHGEGGVYLCSLSAALWYSWGKNGAPSVLEKHPQISKEQIYADERIFIIEAHVNFRSKELGLPEIASVYGEMPQEMSYNANPEAWDRYFENFLPEIKTLNDRKEFVKDIDVGEGDLYEPLRKWTYNMRPRKNDFQDDVVYTGGMAQTIMVKRPIGLRGRNRIVGAYIFENMPPSPNKHFNPICVCTDVIYSNQGSINKGFKAEMNIEPY